MSSSLDADSSTLAPLPSELRKGLIPVAVLAFLSFFSSVSLFVLLAYRLIRWRRKPNTIYHQFLFLIFNLLLADIQQSIAFFLNAKWLRVNEITVGSTTCWAQGWFVSTGDLASGVFCVAIGVHTFASVILNYKMGKRSFYFTLGLLWVFVYLMAIIAIALHPTNIYVRAGAWCWIDGHESSLRLWTHYLWIFVSEFGTVAIYTLLYIMLSARLRAPQYFSNPHIATRARSAAKVMVAYPFVYVVCTLPLASARMASMTGRDPSLVHLCIAGAFITSNGWLDVLLYTLTRRITIFSDDEPEEGGGIETFNVLWGGGRASKRFGTTTTIEALGARDGRGGKRTLPRGAVILGSRSGSNPSSRPSSRQGSTDKLFEVGVKTTTVQVRSDPVELADIMEIADAERRMRPSMSKDGKSFDDSQSAAS